ncbi:MAG TPA: hypothetical protein VMU84_00945 [Thermoanaerobaculia bacterium]|nr:hypothetical protein [Thermoanaerobaculia bacterium]
MDRESSREQQQRIKTLFLQRADSYDIAEVACLTGMPLPKLRREVAAGHRDASKVRGAWRFTWRQAVCVAMERWTLAEIHDALGDDAAAVLPPLLALRAVTVRLPEYIVRALETVAAENETTLDNALHGELIDFAGVFSGRMESRIPGFRRAYLFPGRD